MVEENSLTEILKWYIENGVNEALQEQPVNRLISVQPIKNNQKKDTPFSDIITNSAPNSPPVSDPSSKLIPREKAIEFALAAAKSADTLEALRIVMNEFDGCPLKQTAKNLVFGEGRIGSNLMFVGEAPGAQEDREGIPFVGPAGQLLNRLLAAISVERKDVYITNILPWRPPGNRTPTPTEIISCMPFIERHIELVCPKILILVGGVAAKSLLGSSQGIMRTRGKWLEYQHENLPAPIFTRAILHPAYLLRSPAQKRETWIDLLEIKKKLDDINEDGFSNL